MADSPTWWLMRGLWLGNFVIWSSFPSTSFLEERMSKAFYQSFVSTFSSTWPLAHKYLFVDSQWSFVEPCCFDKKSLTQVLCMVPAMLPQPFYIYYLSTFSSVILVWSGAGNTAQPRGFSSACIKIQCAPLGDDPCRLINYVLNKVNKFPIFSLQILHFILGIALHLICKANGTINHT